MSGASSRTAFRPRGTIPAVLLPFRADLSIDESAFRRHLRDVESVPGVTALTLNAHSTEVSSWSFDEQRRVLQVARDAVRVPIVCGVYADGSLEAQRIARMAEAEGASALLAFPPNIFRYGNTPAMVIEHFSRIADATELPLIAFQYPLAGGMVTRWRHCSSCSRRSPRSVPSRTAAQVRSCMRRKSTRCMPCRDA